jgi:hypothetical protein
MPLFNTTHPSYRPHYVRDRVQPTEQPQPNTPRRPTVRRDFGQDLNASAIVANQPATLHMYSLSGYFSTVRAAMVVNSLAAGAFAPGGLPRYLASKLPTASNPSPTVDAAATNYANHQVMSYLPSQIAAPQAMFASLNDPTKRESLMTSLSETINGSASGLPQTLDNVIPNNVPLIPFKPSIPPWGGVLCNQSQFGVTIKTNAISLNPGTGSTVLQPTNVPGFVSQ